MKVPDKIYIQDYNIPEYGLSNLYSVERVENDAVHSIEFIRKEALLEWANAELERLWELVPDSDKVENETATPMETRYLGQYMQMESVLDKLNEM